jgi:ribosomal protein S18 acetylase RimI-like enzyme
MKEKCEDIEDYAIVEEDTNENVRILISNGLDAYNKAFLKNQTSSSEMIPFMLYARTADGDIIGGVHGTTWQKQSGSWVEIEFAWISDEHRRRGIGRKLFNRVESIGKTRRCTYIQVFTWAFQAVEFYEKLGFERVGTIPKWIEDYDAVFFRKVI